MFKGQRRIRMAKYFLDLQCCSAEPLPARGFLRLLFYSLSPPKLPASPTPAPLPAMCQHDRWPQVSQQDRAESAGCCKVVWVRWNGAVRSPAKGKVGLPNNLPKGRVGL
jgi:hypothetical protein